MEVGNGAGVAGEGGNGGVGMSELKSCLSSFVDAGSTESHRYFLSRRTALEMLRDRGYTVPSSEIELSLEEFRAVHGQNPDIDRLKFSAPYKSDPAKRMLVMFSGPTVLKVSSVRLIGAQIANKDMLAGMIFILENKMTSQAQKALEILPFKVEIFLISDLLINITKHVLKPKHEVLTDQEKQKLLKEYNIEEKQLPRFSKKDAIVRYYGLQKGQVIKVTYSGEITEMHTTYRCVW